MTPDEVAKRIVIDVEFAEAIAAAIRDAVRERTEEYLTIREWCGPHMDGIDSCQTCRAVEMYRRKIRALGEKENA